MNVLQNFDRKTVTKKSQEMCDIGILKDNIKVKLKSI